MKIKNANRWIATGTLGVMTLGSIALTGAPAEAKSSTWKKAAIAGAVVTGYGLVKGKGKVTTVGAAATAGSYYMYRKSKKKENEEAKRRSWYQKRYGRNWRNHYKRGH